MGDFRNTFMASGQGLCQPDESWLSRRYPDINAEIDTSYSTVAIGDYFWQGHEAVKIIAEIHAIWLRGDCDQQQAIEKWLLQSGLD